jgi:hypothetical protein
MKTVSLLAAGIVTLLGSFAIAAGGDKTTSVSIPPGDGNAAGIRPADGVVPPNTFLTFEGRQYELVNLFGADLVPEDQFERVGSASKSDIDLGGDLAVYARRGDANSVYTLNPRTADDPQYWMQWRAES